MAIYYRNLPELISPTEDSLFGVCRDVDSNIKTLDSLGFYEASTVSQYAFYSAQKVLTPQLLDQYVWQDVITDEPLVFRARTGYPFTSVGFRAPYSAAYYVNAISYFEPDLVWVYSDVCAIRIYKDSSVIAESKQDQYQTGVRKNVSVQIDTIVYASSDELIKAEMYSSRDSVASVDISSFFTVYRIM